MTFECKQCKKNYFSYAMCGDYCLNCSEKQFQTATGVLTQEKMETKIAAPTGFEPPSSKTLKLKPNQGTRLSDLIWNASSWLQAQDYHTRIEFKFGDLYYVVAKLKSEKKESSDDWRDSVMGVE